MKTNYININEHKYRIEYVPYEECANEQQSFEFIMLRNFTLYNNIVNDDNLFFIEKNLFEKYKNKLVNHEDNDILVFPSNGDTMYYSSSYSIFNDTILDEDIINGKMVYEILEKDVNGDYYTFRPKKIKCDLIKVYHPMTHVNKNLIIHIENFINNIHCHYFCQLSDYIINSNDFSSVSEYRYENNIYSEYMKCYIPDIKELFDRKIVDVTRNDLKIDYSYDYSTYYKEDMNIVEDVSQANNNFINNTIIKITNDGYRPYRLKNNEKIYDVDDNIVEQYVPLALFTQPCIIDEEHIDKNNNNIIEKEEKIFKKVYFKYKFSIDNNYIITPINITIFPYSYLNKTNDLYVVDESYIPSTCSILNEYKFTLRTIFDFDNNAIPSLLCLFDYPEKQQFEELYNYPLMEAYCFYHHITNKNIYANRDNIHEEYKEELDEIRCLNTIDDETINFLIRNGSAIPGKNRQYYIDILKQERYNVFLEEYIDEFKVSVDFFGFYVEIASNNNFSNIIFEKHINLLNINNNVFDENGNLNIFLPLSDGFFSFDMREIFTQWKQLPETVVCRVTFIDRLLGINIVSNDIYIDKEKFKYILNNTDFNRLDKLTDYNVNMKEINLNNINNEKTEYKKELDEIISDLEQDKQTEIKNWFDNVQLSVNFFNKINCIVGNENDDTNNIQQKLDNVKIIYKPIFFKTYELNNIFIKYSQTQNIGVDLHQYMSKVNRFIMTIDNNIFYETGRNSNFVIFTIYSKNITNNSGNYEIYTEDHEYITYGSWSIVK